MEQERIKRNVAVHLTAAQLLEPSNEPVDAWEISQETGIPEKEVEKAIKDLERQGLVTVVGTAEGRKITATHMMHREG